jgi:hypothetical protein
MYGSRRWPDAGKSRMITALPGALVRTKFLLAATLFAWALPAQASPLNPWGAHVGRKTFALTPFVYFDQTPGIYPLIYGQYGFTDNFELLFGVGGGIYPGTTPVGAFETIELMPRQFFNETSAIALHLTYTTYTGQLDAAPEFHGAYELGPITLTVNAGGGIGLGVGSGVVGVTGGLYGIVAPEWYFTEASSVFLEINPSYDFSSLGSNPNAFALELVPGISTSIAETHYFAFGVGIPVTGFDPTAIYGGVWYSIAFGGDEE